MTGRGEAFSVLTGAFRAGAAMTSTMGPGMEMDSRAMGSFQASVAPCAKRAFALLPAL